MPANGDLLEVFLLGIIILLKIVRLSISHILDKKTVGNKGNICYNVSAYIPDRRYSYE
jgi:hypothetical protein